MKPARRPLFLARSSYRRRRLIDAARLLPAFGAFLLIVPVFWTPGAHTIQDTARDGLYLFGVWFLLIVLAALIARRIAVNAEVETGNTATRDQNRDGD
ncbi:MAG: hypothetical protein R3D84_05415 [Paracoccaceae bacterium]